jgi:4-amino-4-deoxy-L-arabinose transferase-like glycosyltransferase
MVKKRTVYVILGVFVVLSLLIKLAVIFWYKNRLTLYSDDLNYIKSAVVLLKRGILTYQNYNEPTVFIMPLYPLFLTVIFKLFGYGLLGLQIVRVIQAFFSCITIILVFLTAKRLFDFKIALIASFFTAFYIPNITTPGYILTESVFTMLLMALIYFSLFFMDKPGKVNFAVLGAIWAAATLCRPTIALYPIILAAYCYFHHRMKIYNIAKLLGVMFFSFIIIMSPWWIRNYREYGEFIPLAASGGNPMLQGTYINYIQSPEEIVYYKLGKNALETNHIEVETAKYRIKRGFEKDFWGYLNWYTVKKTILYWCGAFYWQEIFGISKSTALSFHYVLLLGIPGIVIVLIKNFTKFILPAFIIVYFNIVHCVYMAFDRYAYPMMTLLTIFSAFFIVKAFYPLVRRFNMA